MTEFEAKERILEKDIQTALCTRGGYAVGDPQAFNQELALDVGTFLSFIQTSQPKAWENYTKIYKDASEEKIVERFCHEVKRNGLLKIMRKGFKDRGLTFYPIFWKPETSINKTRQKQYEANVFHCTRQLHYSTKNNNSVDIVLFVNGIPIVSMELKCQFTGQDTSNAIAQYKFDRSGSEPIFRFKERVLVHFAVDLTDVYMTTRLSGSKTYFLPFNQGSNGAGLVGGKGNPINANGYASDYLWNDVLTKDRLLELLQKYLHLQKEEDPQTHEVISETMIFPRYHQLDVVTKLLKDVKQHETGRRYLIQHSAGSGKSNSIAWLAHRLSGLHNANNEPIFHSVLIVTDRRVLDSQLQNTVYQFDHVPGVVVKVDKGSYQLRDAIESNKKIIITTLQKFPVIYKDVHTQGKRFAVIIDEAHSSQTGQAAKKLKVALADKSQQLQEIAALENEEENKRQNQFDKLIEELATQGFHENMSFFAFTATPKDKTLNMFGVKEVGSNRFLPFHTYSMRQAIEEGFILDVLSNYVTYNMYYKIAKKIQSDPEYEERTGVKAIQLYESLHPHNLAQKTSIMLQHFMDITRHKIGGRAKAMVVTASRLHAVRYLKEFRKQIQDNGYEGVNVLVAFSGEIVDDNQSYTEEKLNKTLNGETIKEKVLPKVFHSEDFSILIVAEKYQTGFDEPLLHTMFVDKRLTGVKAVQTLSRLNRTTRGKNDTFVLDFVNSADDIKRSFEPYYEASILENETDPNTIYELQNTLEEYHVIHETEVERFCELFFSDKEQKEGDMGRLQALLAPAVERYQALNDDKQDLFKSTLARFIRIYSFITQVHRLYDKSIHMYSTYTKFLLKLLPKKSGEKVDLDDKIFLEYYKLTKTFDGSITLESTEEGFKPVTGDAGRVERKKEPLTVLIEQINAKWGTNFTEMDKVIEQLRNDMAKDDKWKGYAQSDRETFLRLFEIDFGKIVVDRFDQNNQFFKLLLENEEVRKNTAQTLGSMMYEQFRN